MGKCESVSKPKRYIFSYRVSFDIVTLILFGLFPFSTRIRFDSASCIYFLLLGMDVLMFCRHSISLVNIVEAKCIQVY